MLLMSIFAGSALLLAAIGIYGLVSYTAQQRTHEIGVRMALGAQSGDVGRMLVLDAMRLALVGIAAGVLAALGLMRFLKSVLFGVRPLEPAVFVGAALLLGMVALVAIWLPVRRACRLDPIQALRYE
jgi:ABC-type antimicrobial peptide transport system permease subunit